MSTGESSTTKQLILYVNIPNNAGILVDIFPDCILVSDVLKKVLLRLNHSLPGYGFYCPSRINKRRASFLLLSKTLHHSRVKNGNELTLRDWYRRIRFRIGCETTVEDILYPEDKPVAHLLEHIIQRRKLTREDTFWPQCEGSWLYLSSTLCENGFSESDQMVVLNKPSDDVFEYLELREKVHSAELPLFRRVALRLAAYECAIRFGGFRHTRHSPRTIDLLTALGPYWADFVQVEHVLREWERLPMESTDSYIRKFAQSIREFPDYSKISFFPILCSWKDEKEHRLGAIDGLIVMKQAESKGNAIEKCFEFSQITRWRVSGRELSIHVVGIESAVVFFIEKKIHRNEVVRLLREDYDRRIAERVQERFHKRKSLLSFSSDGSASVMMDARSHSDDVCSQSQSDFDIAKFPAEIRDLIFGQQTLQVLGIVRLVCKSWKNMTRLLRLHRATTRRLSASKLNTLTLLYPKCSSLNLSASKRLLPEDLLPIGKLDRLHSLWLPLSFTHEHLKVIGSLPSLHYSLQSLTMRRKWDASFTSVGSLLPLTTLTNLEALEAHLVPLKEFLSLALRLPLLTSLVGISIRQQNLKNSGKIAKFLHKIKTVQKNVCRLKTILIASLRLNEADWIALSEYGSQFEELCVAMTSYLPPDEILRTFTRLRTIDMNLAELDTVMRLTVLTSLEVIRGAYCITNPNLLRRLSSLRQLRSIDCVFDESSDDLLDAYSLFPDYRGFWLPPAVNHITDNGIMSLTKLRHLQTFSLNNCAKLSQVSFGVFASLKSLQKLHLENCIVSTETLSILSELSSLTDLNLGSSELTSDSLEKIAQSNLELKFLFLNATRVKSLSCLVALHQLSNLHIASNTNMDDLSITPLTKLTALSYLEIGGTQLSGKGLAGAKFRQVLTSLELSSREENEPPLPIDEEGAKCLLQFPKVVNMHLSYGLPSSVLSILLSSPKWVRLGLPSVEASHVDLMSKCVTLERLALTSPLVSDDYLRSRLSALSKLSAIHIRSANGPARRIALRPFN